MQKRSSIGAKYKSYYNEIFIMQKSQSITDRLSFQKN